MPFPARLFAVALPLFIFGATVAVAQPDAAHALPVPATPEASSVDVTKPVTPDAMPETVALYQLLRKISGHYTLTGQHNPPSAGGRNSSFAVRYTGKIPAVWTSDFGFAAPGDSGSYEAS